MREQLKSLSRETIIYGASTVIGRFLNFLLVPFYVNVLRNASEYGIATSLYTYLSFFNILFTLGLEAAYFRYASKGEKEQRSDSEERALFSTPFWVVFIVGAFFAVVILLASRALVYPAFHDPKGNITPMIPMLTRIIRYGAAIVLLDSLAVIPFAVLRIEQKAKFFASLKLLNIVATLVLNFVFILGFHWGVEGIFLANLGASLLVVLMLVPTVVKRLELHIRRNILDKMLPFGLTNVPANLGAMMVQVIDRPIVQTYLGLAVLGIYQANYRMGFIMMVFVSLFEYAWRPFFLRQAKTDDARARIIFSRVFTYFMLIALLSFLALSFFLPYLLTTPILHHQLLKKQYQTGMYIIPVVLLAYIFQGAYTNFIAGIYIKERNRVLPFITLLGAAVNITANMILVPRQGLIGGIMGAALATLFAYIAMSLTLYWQSQKVYPVAYDWPRILTLVTIVGLAFSVERAVTLTHVLNGYMPLLLLRSGLLLVALTALFVTRFFSEGERAVLLGLIGRGRKPGPDTAGDLRRKAAADEEPVEKSEDKLEG